MRSKEIDTWDAQFTWSSKESRQWNKKKDRRRDTQKVTEVNKLPLKRVKNGEKNLIFLQKNEEIAKWQQIG